MSVRADTYVGATLAAAGWDVVATDDPRRYPSLAADAPAWEIADRVLLSTEPYAFRRRDADALARVHGKPVELIDGQWTSWYGPRAIEGLRQLARMRAKLDGGRRARVTA